MNRVGFATGYDPNLTVRDMAEWMKRADAAGYEVGFFSETAEVLRDAPSALSAFAAATDRLLLGCALAVRIRSPLVMAQTIATLDELSGGRLFVAPGACTDGHARRHGLPPADPAENLVETIEVIRALLRGEEVSIEGEAPQSQLVRLGWKPIRSSVRLLIAATSKKGLRIAGRIGDGVLLNAVCSPEYSVNAIKIVRDAAEEAGRDWSQFQVAQIINCSVEDDHTAAVDAIRWEVATKLGPVQRAARAKQTVGEPYVRREDLPLFEAAWRAGGKRALIEAVPDSYVEGMTAAGTEDEVRGRVAEYLAAGVQLPILRAAAASQVGRLLDLFAPSRTESIADAGRSNSLANPG